MSSCSIGRSSDPMVRVVNRCCWAIAVSRSKLACLIIRELCIAASLENSNMKSDLSGDGVGDSATSFTVSKN